MYDVFRHIDVQMRQSLARWRHMPSSTPGTPPPIAQRCGAAARAGAARAGICRRWRLRPVLLPKVRHARRCACSSHTTRRGRRLHFTASRASGVRVWGVIAKGSSARVVFTRARCRRVLPVLHDFTQRCRATRRLCVFFCPIQRRLRFFRLFAATWHVRR